MSSKRPALIALVCFFSALASREVVSGSVWKLGWALFCFGGLWIAYRVGPREAVAELGLTGSIFRGLGIALLASLPMLIMLWLVSDSVIRFVPQVMLRAVLLAAVTEEILFRGYLFRQLYRRAGWNFMTAVVVSGLLFGLAHIGTVLSGRALEVLGVVGITTLGGAFFAWLFVRWNDNLWVPIGMHLFMNAWWELFAVGPNAIGSWGANGARALAIASAVVVTLRFTKSAAAPAQA